MEGIEMSDVTRRAFLALGAAAALSSCSGTRSAQEEAQTDQGSSQDQPKDAHPDGGAGQRPGSDQQTAAASVARPSTTGPLQVKGSQLTDGSGNPVQLRGVSLHGLAWFGQYVNQELFHQIADEWKANVVRLPLYTAEYNGYCEGGDQAALRQLVLDGANYAQAADLYAIVDWHVLHDLTPVKYQDQALAFFDEMSAMLADHENVIYEICNEPNGSTTWADVKAYAQAVIPVIRANDPDAVILVGTPEWCQRPDQAAADPLDEPNVMYTPHFYAATHKDDLRQRLQDAVSGGLPVFVSEFGICDASGSGQVDTVSADAWLDLMDRQGVSWCMWSLCNKDESASIISPSCQATDSLSDGDLAPAGSWVKAALAKAVG